VKRHWLAPTVLKVALSLIPFGLFIFSMWTSVFFGMLPFTKMGEIGMWYLAQLHSVGLHLELPGFVGFVLLVISTSILIYLVLSIASRQAKSHMKPPHGINKP